ncbi:ABC transporter ATP-binding protein [Thermaerobacter subterraneus]|uniref:ABC-type cobalamin/Fe3+-siderophore transport system, ATPase component n=1 Tax=Thermaerobacter subterraneus DSM 13965 TaxID=867903 RepID=K6Q3F2_9FIRM|nr:ABC transporter ATP-binding protein [Thermaerobacter subterraneus]EKP95813.1 ABC-type cobalamin/Fe3+-siderophore transport system, ATPase component [Thermaerobacter subterraneus DSM 13965]
MGFALEVRGVRVGYAADPVLDGLTLEVRRGEWLGVAGPNGSGKTTLLRTLSGYLKPWAGQVLLDGTVLGAWRPDRRARRLAVAGVEAGSTLSLTVEEYVALGRTPHLQGLWAWESARDREAVTRALAWVGLEALAGRPLATLSAGQRQKALLARALAQEPVVLLLDEPTSHLDLRHQVEIMDLLDRLRRHLGLTLVAVLHDLNLAALYCQRLVLVKDGRVAAAGEPARVMRPEILSRVYGCSVLVVPHPQLGVPQVALLPGGPGGPGAGSSPAAEPAAAQGA